MSCNQKPPRIGLSRNTPQLLKTIGQDRRNTTPATPDHGNNFPSDCESPDQLAPPEWNTKSQSRNLKKPIVLDDEPLDDLSSANAPHVTTRANTSRASSRQPSVGPESEVGKPDAKKTSDRRSNKEDDDIKITSAEKCAMRERQVRPASSWADRDSKRVTKTFGSRKKQVTTTQPISHKPWSSDSDNSEPKIVGKQHRANDSYTSKGVTASKSTTRQKKLPERKRKDSPDSKLCSPKKVKTGDGKFVNPIEKFGRLPPKPEPLSKEFDKESDRFVDPTASLGPLPPGPRKKIVNKKAEVQDDYMDPRELTPPRSNSDRSIPNKRKGRGTTPPISSPAKDARDDSFIDPIATFGARPVAENPLAAMCLRSGLSEDSASDIGSSQLKDTSSQSSFLDPAVLKLEDREMVNGLADLVGETELAKTKKTNDGKERCRICDEILPPGFLAPYLHKAGNKPIRLSVWSDICSKHKEQTYKKEWSAKGYPRNIEWKKLKYRANGHMYKLKRILEDKEESLFRAEFAKQLKKLRGDASKLLRTDSEMPCPGYYGPRGSNILLYCITEELASKVADAALTDPVIAQCGAIAYIQSVLVPEMATFLIVEDMHVSRAKARDILEDSRAVGEGLNGRDYETDLYDDDDGWVDVNATQNARILKDQMDDEDSDDY